MPLSSSLLALTVLGAAFAWGAPPPVPPVDTTARVLDHIRWQSYWLGADPFAVPSSSGATLLQSTDYVGYCVKSFDRCALFSRERETPVFQADHSSPYSPEMASGTWRITTGGRVAPPPATDQKLSAGRVTIADPLLNSQPGADLTVPSVINLQSRPLTRELLGPIVPDAIRLRQRPSLISSLLQSIRLQLFPQHTVKVVVPFFNDSDHCIPIQLVQPSGETSVLLVFQKDRGWWTFRPTSELGSPSALAALPARIEKAAMLTLLANGQQAWSQ